MKFLIAGCLAVLLFSVPQKAVFQSLELLNLKTGAVDIKALSIEREPRFPGIVRLRGNVEIATEYSGQSLSGAIVNHGGERRRS